MTIHLERKIANKDTKYPYQRMSYDIATDENNKLSICELDAVLNAFKKEADGEFNYFITGDPITGEVLYGENFFQALK